MPKSEISTRIAKLSKPEDRLWFGISEVLAGRDEGGEIWRHYFVPKGKNWSFGHGAASLNHKGAAAALALHAGEPAARAYWLDRFEKELEGGLLKGTEPLGKYEAWNTGAVLLVWIVSNRRKDVELEAGAYLYLRATVALLALGAAPLAARTIPWGDRDWASRDVDCPYVAATGARQDPGHLDGDPRAWLLSRLLWPERKLRVKSIDNAHRRQRSNEWDEEPDPELRELLRRKVASETWVWEALDRAQAAGLRLSPQDFRAVLLLMEHGSSLALERVEAMLGGARTRLTFHWCRWPSGVRACWIEESGERNIPASVYDPRTREARIAFPFDIDRKTERAPARCELAGDGLLVTVPKLGREVRLQVPPEPPSWHVSVGPSGVARQQRMRYRSLHSE